MKIAIAGFGLEGEANYNYWKACFPDAEITIYDEHKLTEDIPTGAKLVTGEGVFGNLDGYDLVVRTASLNPNKIKTDGKIWSATNEFFEKCPAQIIGVTGTKGKGTTSTLIYEVLKSAGKDVYLAGNIGKPMLEILPEVKSGDIVVLELSSFQLWDLKKSPHVAVVLMVEPDHLNIHDDLDDYVGAKANIACYQTPTDALYYHPTNQFAAQIAATSSARKHHYMTSESAHIKDGEIVIEGQKICSVAQVGLLGEHNLENICAAISAAWEFTQDVEAIAKAIRSFKGLPNRLEFVRDLDGVKYYNDSFSSAPSAAEAAIKSFSQPEILICGGYDKGINYTHLAKAISEQKNIKKVVLIGQTKDKIADELKKVNFANFDILQTQDFKSIVEHASNLAESGDVVILSPGCASFDMFKDFYERGEQFKQIVCELK